MNNSNTALAKGKQQKGLIGALIGILSSYGLCCLCLFALFILTFFGTLHQIDHGLFDAKQTFFNSWFLWAEVGGVSIPYFPGGVSTMGLLTLNLIVGGLLRIRWSARNVGVIIIHIGIAFMMVAGLVKLTDSTEGHLTLWEMDNPRTAVNERSSAHYVSYTLWEVAIQELTQEEFSTEYILPGEQFIDLEGDLRRKFTSGELPFDIVLKGFVENARVMPKGPQWQATGEVIDGYGILKMDPSDESERDIAAMHAEVTFEGQVQRGILYAAQDSPWVIDAGGRHFSIDMRHRRYPMPFEIRLEDFIKEDHPGISMAKAFRSDVTRIDEEGERTLTIEMNQPMREGGLVLFQSSWGPNNGGRSDGPLFSVFSVVDNPSDKWPEYSMWVITLGLLITFIRTLSRFTRKQLAEIASRTSEAS